jgi:hypothetical protein
VVITPYSRGLIFREHNLRKRLYSAQAMSAKGYPGLCLPLTPDFYPGLYLTHDGSAGDALDAIRFVAPGISRKTTPTLPAAHGLREMDHVDTVRAELAAVRQELAKCKACGRNAAELTALESNAATRWHTLCGFAANRLAEMNAAPEPDLW